LLQGTVATVCSVEIIPNGANLTLPIKDGGQVNVGNIIENCNHAGGYTINASSATGSKLVNALNPNLMTGYRVSVEDGFNDVTLGFTPTPVRAVGALSAPSVNVSKGVLVTTIGNPNALAGDYQDTVTMTIATP